MIIKIIYWRGLSIKLISRGLQMSQMSQKLLIINYLIVLVTRSPRLSGLARSLTEEKQWAAERTQLGWIRVPVQLPPDNRIQYTTRLEIIELRIEMFLNSLIKTKKIQPFSTTGIARVNIFYILFIWFRLQSRFEGMNWYLPHQSGQEIPAALLPLRWRSGLQCKHSPEVGRWEDTMSSAVLTVRTGGDRCTGQLVV